MPPSPSASSPLLIRTADAIRRLGRHVPGAGRLVDAVGTRIRNRTLIIPFGAGRGLRFCARGTAAAHALGLAEAPIQRLLAQRLRPGDAFYDLGANVGFFTLIAGRLVGPSGRVYAFEPAPTTAAFLRENVERNGFRHVEVFEHAVAATSGTAELLVAPGSLLSRLSAVEGPRVTVSPEQAVERVAVPTVALDDFIATQGLRPPTFVKIDVEGAEIEAVHGMRETLARHRPVLLCELHGTGAAFAEAMQRHGYRLEVVEAAVPVAEADGLHVLAVPLPSGADGDVTP
jgi:FkbM family methyltransferase